MTEPQRPVPGAALATAVFLSGAVLLGVEIAASRVLAPTFGSSLYVWGALIGVVLTGLALGYWLGGVLADRHPSVFLLIGALAVGAVLVVAIPLVDDRVLELVTDWDPGPRLDPLLAATLLFGPASVVLASASPIAVRLAARSLDRLGRTAGRLFSVSTIGSIAGTFVTAFWLVPELGTDQVLTLGAAVLLVAAVVLAAAARLPVAAAALAAAAGAAIVVTASIAPDQAGARLDGNATRNWSPLYRVQERREPGPLDAASVELLEGGLEIREARDTRYHRLVVAEDSDSRYLRFDSSFQSGMFLADPYRTRFAYTDYLQVALAYNPGAGRVLVLGLGGGSVQKRLWRDFDDVVVHSVELDEGVVAAAHRWFALPRDRRLPVTVGDGRRFLRDTATTWDVIMVDAFHADGVPFHLATLEFVELLRQRLAPGGVVATNVIGALQGDNSRLTRALVKTYRGVFPTVELHPVYSGPGDRYTDDTRNLVLVATERASPTVKRLRETWQDVRRTRAPRAPDLTTAIGDRWRGELPTADVPYLTDGYAPTDALLLD